MAQFLRDQQLTNITIAEADLDRLNDLFLARVTVHNQGIPAGNPALAIPFYVIRFDNKGYRFIDFADVRRCFREARAIERVVFTIDSTENRRSQSLTGIQFELRLDAKDLKGNYLVVTADSKDWVDATFSAFSEILSGQRSMSRYVRTQWTGLLVQILGVATGFVFSLWAAFKIAPKLSFEQSFVVTFFFALLIYSNVWGYINAQIWRLIDFAFPNVRFQRDDKDFWYRAVQTLVGTALLGIGGLILDRLLGWVGSVLGSLMK